MRVTRSRELVAEGYSPSAVARVAQISRQAIYRVPKSRPAAARRSGPPCGEVDAAIVAVAEANQTDGYRMVTALVVRKLGRAVNRKRVLRVMRERRLIQRRRRLDRRRRPGFFQVTRPNELWHLDMTSVWVAEHGWCYLNAAIDCCTREITGWALDIRCRAAEAITVIEQAVAERGMRPGGLTLGSDNGTAFTSRAFRVRLAERGIVHRRGGYRDPESRRSSRAGSPSSSSAASGARSSRRSTTPAPRSTPTSAATTTDPTRGSPTARRARSPPPGKSTTTSQSQRPD
jgi:putative transposase